MLSNCVAFWPSVVVMLQPVNKAITQRYKKSAIPYMQRMLNDEDKELQRMIGS